MAEKILLLGGWSIQPEELNSLIKQIPASAECEVVNYLDLKPTPFEPEASLIEQLAQQVDHTSWDLVIGWSMGAMLALDAVAAKLISAKSLLLFSPCPSFLKSKENPRGWNTEDMEALRQGVKTSLNRTLRIFRRRCGDLGWMDTDSPEVKKSLLSGLDYIEQYGIGDRLKNMQVPMLLIHGQSDKIIHPSASEKIYQSTPSSELIRVPNGTHALCLNNSSPVGTWIERSLKRAKGTK